MTMYGLVSYGMVLYDVGYTLTSITSGAQYRITDGPQARTARCMDHWTPHLGFDIQKLNSIEMGRRERRKELNIIMRQWPNRRWQLNQYWLNCAIWLDIDVHEDSNHDHFLLKMFTDLVENVYRPRWSRWWCEGSCFNRESDLSLNPDLLQNWTMGDYEADYCGVDLLGWHDPLLCGQFIDVHPQKRWSSAISLFKICQK